MLPDSCKILIDYFWATSDVKRNLKSPDKTLVEPRGENQGLYNVKSLLNSSTDIDFIESQSQDRLSMVAAIHDDHDSSPADFKHQELETSAFGNKFDWHLNLDHDGKFKLDWKVHYASNEIIFGVSIDAHGGNFRYGYDLFALGFSQDGNIKLSDFCLAWFDLSHQIHLQDARTDSNGTLQLLGGSNSSESVCKLISSNEGDQANGEPARLIFKRPLDVCSESQTMNNEGQSYYTIDNGTTNLVWFTLAGPLLSIDGLNLVKLNNGLQLNGHSNGHEKQISPPLVATQRRSYEQGLRRVQLIANRPKSSSVNHSHKHQTSVDIRVTNFQIPARETTYWCKLFKLPDKFETHRYHITRYEAIISNGSEQIVHHMELFNCAIPNAKLDDDQDDGELDKLYEAGGWAGECASSRRPKATERCRKVVMAWAMGAQPMVYPDQVGQSIGGPGSSLYSVLEIHYNNVLLRPNLLDNSGLRFHYTSRLRPYDAGILEVGLEYTDKNSIPPGMLVPLVGYCTSECTRTALSSSIAPRTSDTIASTKRHQTKLEPGIYIFAGQLHTHLAGVASWTEQVREGRLIRELQRDDHYSPHLQEIRLLAEPVHLAPGDALIHYCLYNTKDRSNITLGGFATTDEMCVTYLHYYPRVDLEVCKSSVSSVALEAYFKDLHDDELQATSQQLSELHSNNDGINLKSVSENYHSIEWTPRRAKELMQFYSEAPISVQCNRSDGSRWPGFWDGAAPTRANWWAWRPDEIDQMRPTKQKLVNYRGQFWRQRHPNCPTRGAHARLSKVGASS